VDGAGWAANLHHIMEAPAVRTSITTSIVASLASALTLGCSQPAHAPDAAPGSTVRPAGVAGKPCRSYRAALAEALQGAYEHVGVEADVLVNITLVGNRITHIERVSGPTMYEPYIQDALAKLQCPEDGGTKVTVMPMTFKFREGP
jgi:hypothetical protein